MSFQDQYEDDVFLVWNIKMSNLILKDARFNKMKWDSGQWIAVLMFGENWMQHPLFIKYNEYQGSFPTELIPFKEKVEQILYNKEMKLK